MIKILKKNIKLKNKNFFKSSLIHIQFFFIDKIYILPMNINLKKKNNLLFFESCLGILKLNFIKNIFFFIVKKKLLINFNIKNKKSIINLYNKLIKLKIKGLLQNFKSTLILKGIGFKFNIENNQLILKLGFSHNIVISIPSNIKILCQSNILIFNSTDYIHLKHFVYYVKKHKIPEPYKGKGFLLKNERILIKEGKKSKK